MGATLGGGGGARSDPNVSSALAQQTSALAQQTAPATNAANIDVTTRVGLS